MSIDPKKLQEVRSVAQEAFDYDVDKTTLISDLEKNGWGSAYLDEASLYYDGLKKKVQKQPVAAGVSPSTSAKPVSLSELVPIKGDDTPPYLQQRALKQQEILQEVEKAPAVQQNIAKKNLFKTYESAISTVDSLDKSGETDEAKYRGALSGLSDAYDNYKQKNPDVDLPNFYDDRGGVNPDALSYIEKDRTDTIASEAESRFKSEARRSNFLESGVKQLAGGLMTAIGVYAPTGAPLAARAFSPLVVAGDKVAEQGQREMIGRRLEAGYTQEQIDSGFVGEAAKGNYGDALGLLGQDMLDQTVNLAAAMIPGVGLGILGASAGGSAYLQVKDDDRYSDEEKLVYATTIGAAEYIAERLFMTDINMLKALGKSLTKAGVKKVSDIPKKEFADILFGRLPKALRAPLEEGTEELLVGVVQQSLDKIMADEPFKPVELAEAAILGASMGGGISVLHKGFSSIGKIADLNQTISIRDRVDKINTLLQDPNITDEERSVLTNRLKVAKKEEERIMNNAAIFYANYSQEDAKATLEANQKLSSLLKSADKVKSEEGRAGIIDEIKTQIDTLKQIESKYDSKKGQQVPGAVQAGAQPGGIQQPGEGTEAAAPGGVLQTPEQEALASRVSAADSSAPKLGFKMKTPKRVPLNKDTAPEVYRSLLEAVDNYSDETLAQMQTTREEVREGVKSLFDVVSSLTKSGRDVSVDVYGSVADLNKGLGVSVKKQGREYVVSNEDGTEFYRTNKKKDADRWMGTFQTRGVYVGRNPQDGVTNVAILMPAMVANTGYHEGLHDVIPYVFGDVEISKIARAMAKATKSSARLSDKMLRFIQSYERDGEATQNDEFLTELASLISSGEIEVEVKDSIIDRFMKGLSDILGNPDFLKRKPSTEQFVRLLNEIAKRIGEGRELSVDISKGEVSSPRSQKVYADVVDGFYSPIENRILETKADKQSATKWLNVVGGQDEAIYTGVKGWLESKSPNEQVSKDELLKWMEDNRIEIAEVSKITDGETKYSQYQLEGEKKNYKEILVTLPKPAFKKGEWFAIPIEVDGFSGKEIIWRLKNKNTGQEGVGAYETKELAESEIKKGEKSGGKTDFKSTHFEEPNILVHLRMNTRADADYNKVLFLEEIQSDWGQKGKREGFRQDFVKARPDGENKWDVGGTKILYFEKGVDGKNYRTVNKDGEQVWSKTLDEANKVANERRLDQNRMGVQLAPFVTDTNAWTKLGLKVALREAVRQNADKLAWTTGEQQNERYDLSKSVDYVKNSGKTPNGDTYIDISLPQGLLNLHVNNNGIVTKQLGSMNIVDAEGKGLDEIIGKDVAEKILAAETNTTLKGEGLKVGGKGMKGFYGSPSEGSLGIVGGVAKKLFKQDIGTVVITTRENISSRDKIYEAYDRNGNVIKRGNSESYIKSIAEQNNGTYKLVDARQTSTQHSIDITPELKAEVKQGLPKFQKPTEGTEYGDGPMFSIDGKTKFFHASDQKRRGRLKKSTAPQFGSAVYFSTSKKRVMGEFGDNVTEVELDLKNPLYTNTREFDEVGFLAIKLADDDYGRRKNLKLEEDDTYFYYDFTDISELAEIPGQFISQAAEQMGYDAIVDKGSNDYENEIAVLNEAAIIYEEDKPKFQKPSSALKDVESTTKALEGKDIKQVLEGTTYFHGTSLPKSEKDFTEFDEKKGRGVRSNAFMGAFREQKSPFLFITSEKSIAKDFANAKTDFFNEEINPKEKYTPRIIPFVFNEKDAKVLDLTGQDYESVLEEIGFSPIDSFGMGMYEQDQMWLMLDDSEFAKKIKELGYDAVKYLEPKRGIAIAVLNTKKVVNPTNEGVSEAYHKAKKDGSNPELVKAVEELLSPRETDTPKFQKPTGKGAKNFDKWVGGNRLVTAQELQDVKSGEPIVVRAYHGTTNDFYEFDSSVKGNIEGHLGKLNYFTTDFQDASANYQSTGADLTSRIERRAEDIENFLEDEFDDFYKSKKELSKAYGYTANQLTALGSFSALAKDIAKKELQGGEERVLDVYIKLNNPVVLGNYYNKTWVDVINLSKSDLDEAAVEIADENDISVDEAKSDYESDIRQRAIENTGVESVHVKALERALRSNNYDIFYRGDLVSNIIGDDYFEESIELSAFENQMRKAGIDVNDEGEYAVGQVIADFFKNLGYDGIVLTDVSSRFKNMGLGGSTSHIHVFDDYSNQIKLADGSNVQFNEDTRDIRFQKPGEYKKAVEAAQAEVTNSVGAIFQRLGVDLGKPITRAKAIERRAKMQLPEIDPFKLFKKKYGEGAAKAIRTHVPSAMDYPQQFIDFIEKKVPLTQQIGRVVSEIPTLISADFQLLIGKNFKDRKSTNKTPEEILKETDFTFHRIKSNEDMRVFRADYDDNEVVCTLRDPSRINDFLIFWVRNKYADSILPANKLTIEYLQGDTEGAKMWRKYLKDVHDFEVPSEEGLKKEIANLEANINEIKPNFDEVFELIDNGDEYKVRKIGATSPYIGIVYSKRMMSDNNMSVQDLKEYLLDYKRFGKYHPDVVRRTRIEMALSEKKELLRKLNLPNALQDHLPSRLTEPSREDPYGRSSMSVQIGRGDDYIYKITNRYNHSASEPADSTLDKDLDNLVEGLQEAVLKLDEVTSIAIPGYKNTLPDGIIMDSERNYMAYDYSVDGEWYGKSYFSDYGFYVQDPSEPKTITKIDPNTQKIFMGVVFDTNKKTAMRWEGWNATELIQGADTIGLNIDKIQFSKNSVDIMTSKGGVRIEKDGDDFKLSGNITQIEDGFYFKVKGVKSIDFPNLVEIGDEFMRSSDNVTYLNMPRVKTVGIRFLAYNTGDYDFFNMQSLEHVEFEFGAIKYHDTSFPSLISVGNNFARGSNFMTFSAPKLEFVGDNFLRSSFGVRIYLPSLSEAGSYFLSGVKGRSDLNSTYFWLPNLKKYGGRFLNGALVKEVFMPGANKLLPVQGADLYDLLDKYNEAKDDAYEYVRDNYPNISNFVTALEILNPENNFSYLRWMIDSSDAALKTMADDLGSYNRKIEGVRDFFKIGRADYNDERVFDFMISRLTKHGMRILEAGDYRLNDVSDIPTPVSESKPKFQRPIDQTYEKSQERLKPSTGMGLSGAEKAFIDRQAPLKRALIKANLDYARNLLISQAGSGARAYDFITTSFKNIYGGLTNDQIKNVDKLIFLRRVIQIDEYKAANPQAEKIVHPDNWDGLINNDTVVVDSAGNRKTLLSAKKALADMKSDLGVTEYNLIYNATERYFDTYKKILTDMFEAGLITQGLYDELKNLKYQPRVFINKILMRDENDPSEFRANLQDLSLKSGTIKKLTTGDVSEVIMDSRFLLAVSANSAYSRIAKNKTKREVAKGLGRPDTQDFMSSDKRTGFEEVIYYEDGIKKSFYLRGDLKSQLDDISSQIFQPEVAKLLSTITGSRLIKLFATQANPLFVLKNIPRDYQHVLFFTNIYDNTNIYNAMYLLARDYIKGAKGKLSNSADFKEFLEYGGGMSFFSTENRGERILSKDIFSKSVEALGKLGELSEVAVRLGVYTRVRDNAIADFVKKNGRKPNGEEMDVIKTEAVVSARQIIDFAQGGSFTKNAELVMPYLNASFQGARVSTQYIFNNKIKFLTKILSLAPLVGAIALSNALIGDDDDMDEIPDTVKMMNFIILLPIKNEDGERHYLKIAKAQQLIPFLAAMELGATVTTEALIESSKTPRKDRAFSMQSVSKDKLEYIADAIGAYLPVNVLNKEVGVKELFSRVPAFSAYMAISGNYDAFYDQKVSYDFGEVSPEYEDVQNKKVQYFYKALAQGAADVHDVGAKRLQAGTEKFITGPNSSFVVSAAYAIANEVAKASYDVKTDPLNLGRVVKEDEAKAIGARIASSFLNQAKMAVVRTTDKDIKRYIGREGVDEIILKENATSKALKDEANKLVKEARQEFSETGRYTNVEAKLKEYLKVIEEKGATNQDARRFVNLVKNKMRQVDSGDWPLYYDSIYWASSNRAKLEVIKRAFGEKMTKEDFVEFAKKYSVLTGEKIDRDVYDSYFKTR